VRLAPGERDRHAQIELARHRLRPWLTRIPRIVHEFVLIRAIRVCRKLDLFTACCELQGL